MNQLTIAQFDRTVAGGAVVSDLGGTLWCLVRGTNGVEYVNTSKPATRGTVYWSFSYPQLPTGVGLELRMTLSPPSGPCKIGATSVKTFARETSYGGFSGTNPPPASWRPGDDSSPFNKPVNPSAVHPRSQAKVDWLMSFDDNDSPRGVADLVIPDRVVTGESAAHAICFAKETDPEFTLRQGTNWFPQLNGLKFRIPPEAESGQDGWDFQLGIVQPDGSFIECWQFERPGDGNGNAGAYRPRNRNGGGDVWCTAAGKARVDDDLITDVGDATQGKFDLIAGQIRGEEMAAGRINHALFLVVPGSSRSGLFIPPSMKNPQAPSGGTDKIEVGQRLFLKYTAAEIDALALRPWEKVIYKAFAEFGGLVGDGGGPSSVLCCFEPLSGSCYAPWGTPDPWITYAKTQVGGSGGRYALRWTQNVIDWRNRLKIAA